MPPQSPYSYPLANPSSDNESWYPLSAYRSPSSTTFGSPKEGPVPFLSMMSTSTNSSVAQRNTTWQDKLECECCQLHTNIQHPVKDELCFSSWIHPANASNSRLLHHTVRKPHPFPFLRIARHCLSSNTHSPKTYELEKRTSQVTYPLLLFHSFRNRPPSTGPFYSVILPKPKDL